MEARNPPNLKAKMEGSPLSQIRSIQNGYFSLLEQHFESLWQGFKDSGLSPVRYLSSTSGQLAGSDLLVERAGKSWHNLAYRADVLLDEVGTFWRKHSDLLIQNVRELEALCINVGDLNGMGLYYKDAVLRLGLYFDSTVLIDPFSVMERRRAAEPEYFTGANDDPQVALALINYLAMRSLKDLSMAATEYPIAIVAPQRGIEWSGQEFDLAMQAATKNALGLFNEALGKRAGTPHELAFSVSDLSEIALEEQIMSNETLRSTFGREGLSPVEGLELASRVSRKRYEMFYKLPQITDSVRKFTTAFGTVQGVFLALEGADFLASMLGSDMAIPRQLWKANKHRLKRSEDKARATGVRDEIVAQTAILSEKLDWLAVAKLEDLCAVREEGGLETLRGIYRARRRTLQLAAPNNLDAAVAEVVSSVTEAIRSELSDIDDSSKRGRRTVWGTVGKFTLSGALGIASFAFPPLAVPTLAVGLSLPGGSASDILLSVRQAKKKREEQQKRPIVHMLEIWQRAKDAAAEEE